MPQTCSQKFTCFLQNVKTEIEYDVMKEMHVALGMHNAHMFRKDDFLGKDHLTSSVMTVKKASAVCRAEASLTESSFC